MMRTAAALIALLAVAPARAGDVKMDEPAKKATAKALEWLASQQNPDGSWGRSLYPHSTAVTSFALFAFMSQGHLPGQGFYGPEVAKGARFLVASAREDGFLVGSRGGNMYAHGMATLALAELWGMAGGEDLKATLEKATDLIVRTQSPEGGWRYEPEPTGHDISSTILQVMALRAAKNSGLHVPDQTIHRAIEYVKDCYDAPSGGFRYMPGVREPAFARTAAGVCILHLTGKYDAREIGRAVEFLETLGEETGRFWYGQYYAAHAMHQVGGKKWETWYARTRGQLLGRQSPDGSWASWKGTDDAVGPEYRTAVAVTILSVPLNYLPIFQR
jgi:squalene cyclase